MTPSGPSHAEQPVALIASSGAGHAGDQADLTRVLAGAGLRVVEQLDVADLDARRPMGERWRRAGLSAVVAAGGDGTLGTVATHLLGSGLPLGILPTGTSNDVARSLGVPLDLPQAAQVIAAGLAAGVTADVDLGQAAPAVTEPGAIAVGPFHRLTRSLFRRRSPAEREALNRAGACFLHAATLGLNVEFARLATDVARREHWGPLNYPSALIETLTQVKPIDVAIELRQAQAYTAFEGAATRPEELKTLNCRIVQIAVVNTRIFGGGLNLELPGADARDHLLDIVIVEALEPRHLRETIDGLLAALGRMKDRLAGSDTDAANVSTDDATAGLLLPGVRHYQARSLRIATPTPLDVTLDGEIRGRTPIDIRIAPQPLRVLLPTSRG